MGGPGAGTELVLQTPELSRKSEREGRGDCRPWGVGVTSYHYSRRGLPSCKPSTVRCAPADFLRPSAPSSALCGTWRAAGLMKQRVPGFHRADGEFGRKSGEGGGGICVYSTCCLAFLPKPSGSSSAELPVALRTDAFLGRCCSSAPGATSAVVDTHPCRVCACVLA